MLLTSEFVRTAYRLALVLGMATGILSACAPVGPDFVKPGDQPPGQWSQELNHGLEPIPQPDPNWWKQFNDPVLDKFVETGIERNNNLQIAGLRVLESQANLNIAG